MENNQKIEKQNKTLKYYLSSEIIFIALCVFLLFGINFYWYGARPAKIKKGCSGVNLKTYSHEQKNSALEYVNKNCPRFSSDAECLTNRDILEAPLDGQMQRRAANDEEYKRCLRENGL